MIDAAKMQAALRSQGTFVNLADMTEILQDHGANEKGEVPHAAMQTRRTRAIRGGAQRACGMQVELSTDAVAKVIAHAHTHSRARTHAAHRRACTHMHAAHYTLACAHVRTHARRRVHTNAHASPHARR